MVHRLKVGNTSADNLSMLVSVAQSGTPVLILDVRPRGPILGTAREDLIAAAKSQLDSVQLRIEPWILLPDALCLLSAYHRCAQMWQWHDQLLSKGLAETFEYASIDPNER